MHAKYVVVEYSGLEVPVVFPPEVDHRALESIGRIVSAGFCNPNERWCAFGESEALQVAARVDRDSLLLSVYFGDDNAASESSTAGIQAKAVTPADLARRSDGDQLIAE